MTFIPTSIVTGSSRSLSIVHPLRNANQASSSKASSKSIFDQEDAAWEQVFKDVEPNARTLLASTSPSRSRDTRRQRTLTASEAQAFDEMFNTLFNTVESMPPLQVGRTLSPSSGVGKRRMGIEDDFISVLQSRKSIKWTSEADQELDRKKEEMDLCETDQQLLEWGMREVFAESQRHEEAARKVASNPSSSSSSSESPVYLQPPSYPHLVAELMRKFRDKYSDPYLSLAIFDYARNLSIASYVFGCTTPAYNELIETRWRCFRDLRGVCDALEEMRVNGVAMDTRTRGLAETVRREVGQRNLWEEETAIGSGDVWVMLQRIERLTAGSGGGARRSTHNADAPRRRWTKGSEVWRSHALQNHSTDGWEFGQWNDVQ
ncbi:hypothetical protein NM688_g7835 [Phlebia brevispora]|uniref:Uncharacterized protein n=1 Tax=Phlebia brevispora TaxID=194682 RepID=A0ACC1S0K8_9APHY|nr:hypothetical protein NM688_g7835 [Phlebia brevispora]